MVRRATHITVLGGGPAGLAAAAAAGEMGLETVVFEAADRVGGNCRTFSVDGFRFDSGAHRLHDRDPEITAWFADRLGDALHEVCAPSRIWDDGKWLGFPITATGLARHLGVAGSIRAGSDLVRRRLGRRDPPGNFLDFALRAYGRPVAERFLLNYSEKLWGEECSRLSTKIAGSRLAGIDLRSLVTETLNGRGSSKRHVEGRFFYPDGGIGAITRVLAEAAGSRRIRTGAPVRVLEHDGRRITAVRTDSSGPIAVDRVVSSLPLSVVGAQLDPQPPADVRNAIEQLRFRQVVLVVLFVDRPSLTDCATVYFPDRSFPFTRLCEPRNRCRTMAPEGRTSVAVEVPCFVDDPVWRASDDELIDSVRGRLAGTALILDDEVIGGAVRRLRNAYPVLETSAVDAMSAVRSHLQRFENLHLVGRCGTFTYGWIHDMVREGREAVDAIAGMSPRPRAGHAPEDR